MGPVMAAMTGLSHYFHSLPELNYRVIPQTTEQPLKPAVVWQKQNRVGLVPMTLITVIFSFEIV